MAYDMVKQTIDAPNSPFKTVRGAKQREKIAHAIQVRVQR